MNSVVWAKVQSLCLRQSDVINVPPLQDSTWAYNAPSGPGNLCQCNVVSYSLMVSLPPERLRHEHR